MTDRTVRIVLKAVADEYRKAMRDSAKDTEGLGQQVKKTTAQTHEDFKRVGQGAILAGGVMLAGFGVAVGAAARFEKGMSNVKAVANATAGEMKQLSDAAIKAGADTAFSATDAAEAEAELAKAGIGVKDILGGALTGALSLAAAGQLDLAEAATTSAQAMNIFKLQGSDVGHVADVLAAAANKSAADVRDLADGLKQGGLVAAQTGLSLEETAGALAAFADNALLGSDAGTSMKTMLQRLVAPSNQAREEMDKLGITAYDAQGNFIGLERFAGKLREGMSRLTPETRNAALATIFGSDAIRAAAIIYDQGADGIHDYIDAVNDQGAAARMAATQMDNLAGDVEALKGSIETGLIQSGSGANKVLREIVQSATSMVNVFNDLPGPVQEGAAALVAVGGAAAVIGGAALVSVGQLAKFKTSLETIGVSAGKTERAVGLLGKGMKGLGTVGAVLAAAEALNVLIDVATHAPKMGQLGEDMVDFAQNARVAGELAKIGGEDLSKLGDKITQARENMAKGLNFVGIFSDDPTFVGIRQARKDVDGLDSALAALVASGNADLAARDFKALSAAAIEGGASQKDVTDSFPKYQEALASARTEMKLATQATGDGSESAMAYVDAMKAETEASKQTADAIRNQSNALKAMFDPLFATQDALIKQKDAQDAVNKALKEHGRKSEEYKKAQQDAFRATVDLDGAVENLRAGLMDGSISLSTVNGRLDDYVRAGLLSKAQAKAFKEQLAGVVTQVKSLSGELDGLNGKDVSATVTIKVAGGVLLPNGNIKVAGGTLLKAEGGYVTGPGTAKSDSIPARLSNGEYVINAAATAKHRQLLDMINGGGMFRPWTPQASSVDNSRTYAPTFHVQQLPGENVIAAASRAQQKVAFENGYYR